MAFIVTNEGEREMLNRISAKNLTPSDLILRLFTNNYVPTEDSVFADFVEPVDTQYAMIPLPGSSWDVATVGGASNATMVEQVFNFGATATVYGYFVTTLSGADEICFLAERFPAPHVVEAGGGTIGIPPKLQLE
jgi:hypothetical protein